jgi:uncharacterized protein (DUF1499 family)
MVLSLVALGIGGAAFLLLGLAGPLYRIGVPLEAAFALLRWGAYFGVAAAAVALVAALWAYRQKRRLALGLAIMALVLGAIAAGIPFAWQQRAQRVPPIHDITTDLENPPAFEAVGPLRADAPNTLDRPPNLASQQREGYADIAPLTLPLPPDQAFTRALAVAQDMGWEIVAVNQQAGRIEATDTTRWFGFRDDVIVRLTPWGSGTRVDVRSVSRVGRSDVGTNARRIRGYLDALAER